MKLKEVRQKKKMTQLELARAAGMSQSAIALLETGKRSFSIASLNRVAAALRVSPKSLLPGTRDT